MSAATVTYHELPPMSSWAAEGVDAASPFHPPAESADPQPWTAAPFSATSPAYLYPHYHHQHSPFTPEFKPFIGETEEAGGVEAGGWGQEPPPLYHNGLGDYPPAAPSPKKARLSATPTRTAPVGIAEELCLVCGDKASGYHYNSLTCEGCKGFFRRSITRKAVYYCKYGGNCDIDMLKYMRRKCQCCRLRKCMEVGMRPERLRPESQAGYQRSHSLVVIPEDQCRIKREAKQKMRNVQKLPTPSPRPPPTDSSSPQDLVSSTDSDAPSSLPSTPAPPALTPEQRELLSRLLLFQHQFDAPSNQALSNLSTFTSNATGANQPFQHLAELTILSVQLIVEFTKNLPGFLTLLPEDQLTLLKASSTEVLMLRTARRYDAAKDRIVLGNSETSWAYDRTAYREAGIGAATDPIFDFAASLAKLNVDSAEYALLTAVAIFSDRTGLKEPKKVEDIQEVYTSTLQAYIDVHRAKQRSVFARLLMKLSDLRSLGSEQAEMLLALTQKPGRELTSLVKVEAEDWAAHSDTASSVSSLHPHSTAFPFPTTPSPTSLHHLH